MAERRYSAIVSIGAALEGTFGATFRTASDEVGALTAKLKDAEKGQKLGESFTKLQADVTKSQGSLVDARNTLASLEAQMQSGAPVTAKLRSEFLAQRETVARLEKAYGEKRQRLAQLAQQLKAAGVDTRNVTAEMARLRAEAEKTKKDIEALTRAQREASEAGKQFADSAKTVGTNLLAVGAAAGIAVGAAYKLTKGFADFGDDAADMAGSLGVSTERLLGFRYAASTVGIDASIADMQLGKMSQAISDAQNTAGPAAKALEELGLSADELATMTADEQVRAIADAFRDYQGPVSKAALAQDVFGRGSLKLVSLLNEGSDGLNRLQTEAERAGYVLNEQGQKAAGDLASSYDRLGASIIGVRNLLAQGMAPAMVDAADSVSELVGDNREGIIGLGESLGKIASQVLPPLISFTVAFLGVAAKVGTVISTVVENTIGWNNAIAITAALLMGPSLMALGATVASMISAGTAIFGLVRALGLARVAMIAFNTAMAANPIGLVLVGISAAIALIVANWDGISDWFSKLWDDPIAALLELRETVWRVFKWSPLGIMMQGWGYAFDYVGNKIEWLSGLWTSFKDLLGLGDAGPTELATPDGMPAGTFTPPPLAQERGGNRTTTTQNSIVVQGAPGQDEKAIADEVMRRLNEKERAQRAGALHD